jgi:hypothetical protein
MAAYARRDAPLAAPEPGTQASRRPVRHPSVRACPRQVTRGWTTLNVGSRGGPT